MELTIYRNQEFGSIRATNINGEPWLSGRDIAAALGYKNQKDALLSHVDDNDRRVLQRSDFTTLENNLPKEVFPVNFVPAEIPNRGATFINESGVYSLIFGSKLPKAKEFKHWVTSEVLPSIRKNGGYIAGQETMTDSELIAKALIVAQRTLAERNRLLEEQKPKVIFADAVAASKTTILIGELAKILKANGLDTGQNRLFELLRRDGYLINRKGTDYNMPTQKSMDLGLMMIKESVINQPDGSIRVNKTPKITGKGQQYFINRYCKA